MESSARGLNIRFARIVGWRYRKTQTEFDHIEHHGPITAGKTIGKN